jgi:hypothetical protein
VGVGVALTTVANVVFAGATEKTGVEMAVEVATGTAEVAGLEVVVGTAGDAPPLLAPSQTSGPTPG